jgi:perosamine synthetase
VFSFYANKLVTTGEGGMVVTDDDSLAERARSLRNLGFGRRRRFLHETLGSNYRLTNLQAALALPQIERMDEIVARKRAIAAAYTERLGAVDGLELPAERPWARSVYWMYGLLLSADTGLDADALAARLAERGVETRPFFLGMHEQPAFHRLGLFRGERYPVAERLARQGLYLPSGLALTDEQLELVCDAVVSALA